jgi:uncharacterized protein (TIGR03067 family)
MLTACLLALSLTQTPQAKPDDATAMEGSWVIEKAEMGGTPFPAEVTKDMTLVLTKGGYVLKTKGPEDKGTTAVDATKSPKQLDIKGTDGPNKGKTLLCIYTLDGDTLTVCYDLSGKARPTEFKSATGTQQFLATYKRVKK